MDIEIKKISDVKYYGKIKDGDKEHRVEAPELKIVENMIRNIIIMDSD